MRKLIASVLLGGVLVFSANATTITVVPIFEPLSLHGSDGDDVITDIGEALQASVMSRPMALTGAFPEVLVDAIRSTHKVPTNNENYTVQEVNLLVLCNIGISSEIEENVLIVKFDVSSLSIPQEVDLTSRQVLRLAIIALRKTLDEYQRPQTQPLSVELRVEGVDDAKASLRDLGATFVIGDETSSN